MSKSPKRKLSSTNYRNEADLIAGCPLAAAMKLLGGRWKPMIVWYVHHGLDRFGALRRTIPMVSEKMLYQHLRELEHDGLLTRSTESARHVVYALTPFGRSLVPLLEALARWSEEHAVGARWLEEQRLSSTA